MPASWAVHGGPGTGLWAELGQHSFFHYGHQHTPSPSTPPRRGFYIHQLGKESHQAILTQAWETQENHRVKIYV